MNDANDNKINATTRFCRCSFLKKSLVEPYNTDEMNKTTPPMPVKANNTKKIMYISPPFHRLNHKNLRKYQA